MVGEQLELISRALVDSENDPDTKAIVFVLGRYRFDRDLVPAEIPTNLDVSFSTVHTSKRLEADYFTVPNTAVGTGGFPSEIEDDPVLDLAMTESDTFLHAEERRLFYVALTRARLTAVLISALSSPSFSTSTPTPTE